MKSTQAASRQEKPIGSAPKSCQSSVCPFGAVRPKRHAIARSFLHTSSPEPWRGSSLALLETARATLALAAPERPPEPITLGTGGVSGPVIPQSKALSFYTALPSEIAYTGNSAGNRTDQLYSNNLRSTTANVARIEADVGMFIEPAATNLLANSRMLTTGNTTPVVGAFTAPSAAVSGVTVRITAGSNIIEVNKVAHGLTIDSQVFWATQTLNLTVS
jgi:hypothetical protein